ETAAISHRAVGEFEQRWKRRGGFRINLDCRVGEFEEVERAFEAASEIEKAPAVAARHVFHFHSAEGGEIGNKGVDECKRVCERKASGAAAGIALKLIENAPGIRGKTIAHHRCDVT